LKRFLSSLLTPDPLGKNPQILVIQLKRIGELVLSSAALECLRQTWPGARITLVVDQACEGLVSLLPHVDEVLTLHHQLRADRVLYRRILTGTFDVCLDLTGTDRSAVFALASRARRRVAFSEARKGVVRGLVYQSFVSVSVEAGHMADQVLELLKAVGVSFVSANPVLRVPALAMQRIGILLRECGVAGDFVLVHPGSAEERKYWLPERWAEVILHLQHKHQLPCVLTGGGDAYEQEHLRQIQTALAVLGNGPLPLPLVTLSGRLDLPLLTALVARSRLTVSSDTAVVHLAAAFARPQVVLYGPTNPYFWRPRHGRARVISAGQPDRALEEFSPQAPTGAMSEIPVATVLETVDGLLAGGSGGRDADS
jgi:ADP-heptose:LPS heptosyltransferase